MVMVVVVCLGRYACPHRSYRSFSFALVGAVADQMCFASAAMTLQYISFGIPWVALAALSFSRASFALLAASSKSFAFEDSCHFLVCHVVEESVSFPFSSGLSFRSFHESGSADESSKPSYWLSSESSPSGLCVGISPKGKLQVGTRCKACRDVTVVQFVSSQITAGVCVSTTVFGRVVSVVVCRTG